MPLGVDGGIGSQVTVVVVIVIVVATWRPWVDVVVAAAVDLALLAPVSLQRDSLIQVAKSAAFARLFAVPFGHWDLWRRRWPLRRNGNPAELAVGRRRAGPAIGASATGRRPFVGGQTIVATHRPSAAGCSWNRKFAL